jgi:hypothetical protein
MAPPKSGPNSSQPTTAEIVGGVYNAAGETLVDGQGTPLQTDAHGNLLVNVAVNSGGGGAPTNVNIADVNGSPPALSNPLPVELSDGTNAFGTAGNPLSVAIVSGELSTVTVVQPTGTNLHTVVDSGTITAVTAITNALPTGANTIGKVDILGNAGAILDGTAGVPSVGVVTVQGVGGGTAIPVSGTVTITPSGTQTVAGNKTNNNAAPGATNVGTLPAIANAAAPVWTEGDQVALSVDLAGNQREKMQLNSFISTANSTTTPLAGNGVFTGTSESVLPYQSICIQIFASGGSAAGGVSIQQSQDGTNWDIVQTITYGGGAFQITVPVLGAFYRIVYTNTAVLQTTFRLQSILQVIGGQLTVQGTVAPAGAYLTTAPNPVIVGGKTVAGTAALVNALTNLGSGMGANQITLSSDGFPGDATAIRGFSGPGSNATGAVATAQMAVTSATQSATVFIRTPNIFKTAQATASGNTAVWTPTSGKKFRLMRFIIDVTSNSSQVSGGVITFNFQDASSALGLSFDAFVPTTAVTTVLGGYTSGWIDIGNGFLSALANNVLNINLSAALATGNVRITVCGTEE